MVGAGGWAYFQIPGTNSLEAYSRIFDYVELNSSYYQLPHVSTANEWRRRVKDDFQFSVRCPRIIADHYGLELVPGSRTLLKQLEEVCKALDAPVMTVLLGPNPRIKQEDLASRVANFLEEFDSDKTQVALEFRKVHPSEEVFNTMKNS